jgi:hypothetical protein
MVEKIDQIDKVAKFIVELATAKLATTKLAKFIVKLVTAKLTQFIIKLVTAQLATVKVTAVKAMVETIDKVAKIIIELTAVKLAIQGPML